jgi:hypothetical protein
MWSVSRRRNTESTMMPITEIADGRLIRALTRRLGWLALLVNFGQRLSGDSDGAGA